MSTDATAQNAYSLQNDQKAINAGQAKINFALTEADRRLMDILEIVKTAIQAPPGHGHTYVPQIDEAIRVAIRAIDRVAEIKPPGCDPTPPVFPG